jgi:uncharacterized protein YifN (PemK superfamily)
MGILKQDIEIRNSIKGKLASIVSELDEVESLDALKMIDWYLDKSKYYKKALNKERFQRLPDNMNKGDIVLVDYGININPEFGDNNTIYHFGLIWAQQGHNFIIIPLTKKEQPKSNKLGVNLGKIKGLPKNDDTYAKIDAIKSVSIRRIKRLKEQSSGKITITDKDVLKKISDVFLQYFV